MWSSRNLLNSLLWEAAHDDMGIYMAGKYENYGTPEEKFIPRTEWQDGWNAAVMEMTKKYNFMLKWTQTLTEEQTEKLTKLLDSDGEPVKLHLRDGDVKLWIWCNDTFMYACSDSEDFELADLDDISRLWEAHGYYGLIAWIARKRKTEPVKEYRYEANYVKAKAELEDK